ncbi:precorrin-6x reductase [Propionibacterium sp. oral taxon 192 str. F0372]|nr:precorrin-6x reductase [Propionibacterium sp. oral taxon 192 str. F0372]
MPGDNPRSRGKKAARCSVYGGCVRILLLGGTADSRHIADELTARGHEVLVSMAGRTAAARASAARVGGFGGPEGLAAHLTEEHTGAVVDATHPFADRMHHNAAAGCAAAKVPLIRFERPGWRTHRFAEEWVWVGSHAAAAGAAAGHPGTKLLTVGRQPLSHYLELHPVVARIAEADATTYPPDWQILEARGPFGLDDELDLLSSTNASVLVTKDSGGDSTAAKLDAAHQLQIPVVMVARPAPPAGVVTATSIAEVLAALG